MSDLTWYQHEEKLREFARSVRTTVEEARMIHDACNAMQNEIVRISKDFEISRKACFMWQESCSNWMDRALKAEAANTDFDKLAEKRLGQS